MATTLNGWESALYWGWEATLGSTSGSAYTLWPTAESDSLTVGDPKVARDVIYGGRFQQPTYYQRAPGLAGGSPGSIPFLFQSDGSHMHLMRILRSHFQYGFDAAAGKGSGYWFFWPSTVSAPTWRGLSFIRRWGTGNALDYEFRGGVIDTLSISWNPTQKMVLLKPTMKFMHGTYSHVQDATLTAGMPSTYGYVIPPNITITVGETTYTDWAGFELVSSMGFLDKMSTGYDGRAGFSCGPYTAKLKLQKWINDDDLKTALITPYCSGAVGTITIALKTVDGFCSTYHGKMGEANILFYYTVNSIPSMKTRKGPGVEMIELEGVLPTSDSTYPAYVQVYSNADEM